MRKREWHGVINITLALTLVLSGMLAHFAFPQPVSATAGRAPGNTLGSAGTNGGLLQFTSAGHVLGFSEDGVIVASARHMLRTDFLDARAVSPEADGETSGESGAGALSPLGRVTYRNLWDGVTVVYEASEGAVAKSTYYLDATEAGVRVDLIRLGYNRPVQIDEKGNLLIIYEDGTMVEGAPVAWQETEGGRKPVTVTYDLRGEREVGFSLGDYAPGIPVVIDPVMTWNSFLGGSAHDSGTAIAVDGSGNVYVAGTSSDTWGSPEQAHDAGANDDAFAARLNSSDGNLTWNTFLGGSGRDSGSGIAVDGSNVYVTGYGNADWGSPERVYSGSYDVFAARLDSSDGALTWHTFLGGGDYDSGYGGIAVDGSGNVYVVGDSEAYWQGASPPVGNYTAGSDAFAARLGSDGALQWHTFLGGSSDDYGYAIAVDSSLNVYVSGYSDATWGSPMRGHYGSGTDAFAARLGSDGALQWHTFLGGSSDDYGYAIAVDGSGNVYIAGQSGADWGPPERGFFGSGNDAFAAKLDLNGNFVPPWASYNDPARAVADDIFVSNETTVYMKGTSIANVSYLIAYYDDNGAKVGSETRSASSGTLTGNYTLADDLGAAAGTWHALVQPGSGYTGFGSESYATITASPTTYGLTADDSFIVEADAIPVGSEINLKQNVTNIPDGGSYDFGSRQTNTNTNITFTIENTGKASLTLPTPITIVGANAGEFSIQQQPVSPVGISGSTPFIVRFTPTSAGTKTATISIDNDDLNENPYGLTIQGTGVLPAPTDGGNGDQGYYTSVLGEMRLITGYTGKVYKAVEATFSDGMLTINIPKGTVIKYENGQGLHLLKVNVNENPPPPPENKNIIGLVHDFEPDGATFDPPITLTFTYDRETLPEGVAPEDLVIAYWDEGAGAWVELPTTVDPVTDTITADVEHFTSFALLARVPVAPPPPVLAPAAFTSSSLSISPLEVDIGETVTISILVSNTGEEEGSYTITLKLNGVVEATKEITLAGGASETVTFTAARDKAGSYSVDVDGLTGSFTVKEVALPAPAPAPAPAPVPPAPPPTPPLPEPTTNWLLVGGIVAGVIVVGLLVFFLARRRTGY